MTENNHARELAKRAGRVALGPVTTRLDMVRRDTDLIWAQQAELAAAVEQATAAARRLEIYLDRFRDEVQAEIHAVAEPTGDAVALASSILAEFDPAGGARSVGTELRARLEHGLLHAETAANEIRRSLHQELADLRSSTRLTQSLVERALALPQPLAQPPADGTTPVAPEGGASEKGVPAAPTFTHPVPSFDLLYRAFEDRHRGKPEEITARQRDDYLELLEALPSPDLPIADLGCGRGELVRLLDEHGLTAIGVDSNQGQVFEGEERLFVEGDMFQWLDQQADRSHRAVVAMHVAEHLPLDLQIRLVFEARRVLVDGGLLALETPNALSVTTAATNFWVDPTHERPVHPALLEFLAGEAGFSAIELRPLHPVALSFSGREKVPELVDDLNSLLLGSGDMALLAHR